MPRQYESIRDDCIRSGRSRKFCKTKAAKIYNALRRKNPSLPKLDRGDRRKEARLPRVRINEPRIREPRVSLPRLRYGRKKGYF